MASGLGHFVTDPSSRERRTTMASILCITALIEFSLYFYGIARNWTTTRTL